METHEQTAKSTSNRTVLLLAIWTFAWLVTLALAKFGPELLWNEQPVASWIAIAVNVAAGVAWIVAHARYLRSVDDLQRKILMDALAVALGVGLVGGFAFSAANTAGLISFDSDLAFVSVLMAVVYMIATAAGTLRYR